MITLKNIYKGFPHQDVLKNFNYQFSDTGFYLLFGPSGCGKTTLLNIIAGIWKYDSGEALYYDQPFAQAGDLYFSQISYITQDAYYVDYLSIIDNLRLCEQNDDRIQKILEQLHLGDVKNQYPSSLSGGERQRLAIVRSLLLHRDIFLLDEPTSALDKENRDIIISILNELKRNHLIICVSHDPIMKEHCDQWIDFKHLETYEFNEIIREDKQPIKPKSINTKVNSLFPFVKKQFRYYKINKRISVFIALLVTSIFLSVFLLLDMKTKIISSLGSDHHANTVRVSCPLSQQEFCLNWTGKNGVEASVYEYSEAAMYFEKPEEEIGKSVSFSIPYDDSLLSLTLPAEKNLFFYSDKLAYGDYVSDKTDILLGYHLAEKTALSYATDPVNLIGRMIDVETAHGKEQFRVSGIFEPFSEKEEIFFRLLGKDSQTINSSYFFTSSYSLDYLYDKQLSQGEKGEHPKNSFIFYFSSYEDAIAFQDKYEESNIIQIVPYTEIFSSTLQQYDMFSIILIPILFLLLTIMIVFHLFIQGVQMKYEKHILSVYQYCGYSLYDIERATFIYYAVEMSILCIISFITSVLLGYIINYCNTILHFSAFPLFRASLVSVIAIYACMLVFGWLFLKYQFHTIKTTGWYDLLRSRRDFL